MLEISCKTEDYSIKVYLCSCRKPWKKLIWMQSALSGYALWLWQHIWCCFFFYISQQQTNKRCHFPLNSIPWLMSLAICSLCYHLLLAFQVLWNKEGDMKIQCCMMYHNFAACLGHSLVFNPFTHEGESWMGKIVWCYRHSKIYECH